MRKLKTAVTCLGLALIWTGLVKVVDVQAIGPDGSEVGFALINGMVHEMTGVHRLLYEITDWLGLVPLAVCVGFGILGIVQSIQRGSPLKADHDLITLGVYYVIVICLYVLFEVVVINYRPVLVEGRLEASYPSSTTLLVVGVMPTLVFQMKRRMKNTKWMTIMTYAFMGFMVIGRLLSGVHWFTDIIGALLFGGGLFYIYVWMVERGDRTWNSMKNFRNCEKTEE